MKKTSETLFSLIRYLVVGGEYGKDRAELEDERLVASVCSLAAFHDMAHLVAEALGRLSVVIKNEKLANAISREQLKAIFRSERTDAELDALYALFEDEKIEYMPLKGAVIRELYPEKWMRTSCDIDLLVRKCDLERAGKAMRERLGYEFVSEGDHDAAYNAPSGIRLELHYALSDEGRGLELFDKVWERAVTSKEGGWRRDMDGDLFYLYHVAHMAKHMENGGCGIKPFLDLCFVQKRGENLLAENRLDRFEAVARRLSEVWFFGADSDSLCDELADYVLRAGVYGNLENAVAAGQAKRGGRVKYILTRIFLPYDRLKYHYPILQKHKWLLPLCQVRRWCKLLFCGGAKRSAAEIKTNAEMSGEREKSVSSLFSELGILP